MSEPLASPLRVLDLLRDAMRDALEAAADLAAARGRPRPHVGLDDDHVAVAACSERFVRIDGAVAGAAFDPLSAFFTARDGWVRTHGNYEHHRAALLRSLGGVSGDPRAVAAAIAARDALDVEAAVVAAGGCAAAVRTPQAWTAAAAGRAVAGTPATEATAGPPCPPPRALRAGELPCAGVRVLDLTRVIAGPIGTRTLAALGADVVRVEHPGRPELPLLALDGGVGKRWARLDLAIAEGAAWLERELGRADVVVDGLRPGALSRFGMDAATLARRHPQVTLVSLSAWGERGPWGARRGFDSLVQAATGIASLLGDGERPGALPVQALDHATGHLLAAAAMRALATRASEGRSGRARLALAATAADLLRRGVRQAPPAREVDPSPYLVDLPHPRGRLTVAAPPGTLDGEPLRWPVAYS